MAQSFVMLTAVLDAICLLSKYKCEIVNYSLHTYIYRTQGGCEMFWIFFSFFSFFKNIVNLWILHTTTVATCEKMLVFQSYCYLLVKCSVEIFTMNLKYCPCEELMINYEHVSVVRDNFYIILGQSLFEELNPLLVSASKNTIPFIELNE